MERRVDLIALPFSERALNEQLMNQDSVQALGRGTEIGSLGICSILPGSILRNIFDQ
jgi:hypothetical protein